MLHKSPTMIVKPLSHPAITVSSSRTTMGSEALPSMEGYVATSEATGAPNETSGPSKSLALFVLPRELRDMIYGELVASRKITILRASKTTHEEASVIMHEETICRRNKSNKGTLLPHSNLSKSGAPNIQHLDIQIVFTLTSQQDKASKYNTISQFGSAEIVRKTCHISFTIFNTPLMRRNLTLALDHLQTLFGFKHLSVRVDVQAPGEYVFVSQWHPFNGLGTPTISTYFLSLISRLS